MSTISELDSLPKSDLIRIILQLQKKIIEIENELKKYKNSNTPHLQINI